MTPQLKIVVWSSEECAPCAALKKAKTLERALENLLRQFTWWGQPGAQGAIEMRDVDTEDWDTIADGEDITHLPTVDLYISDRVLGSTRISRIEGGHSSIYFTTTWRKAVESYVIAFNITSADVEDMDS